MMDNPTTTIILLVLIILAAMWKSGRLGKLLNTIFAPSQSGTVQSGTSNTGITYTRTNPNASWSDYAKGAK